MVSASCFAPAAHADFSDSSGDKPLTEELLRNLYDFTIEIKVEKLDQYMNHKGSKMSPLSCVHVTYRLLPKPRKPADRDLSTVDYEDLYYSGNLPIAVHKIHPLSIPTGEVGIIRVLDNDYVAEHPVVATSTIVRTYLELTLRTNKAQSAFVPKRSFSVFVQAMPSHKFYPTEGPVPVGTEKTSITINILSEPMNAKYSKTFCYGKRLL